MNQLYFEGKYVDLYAEDYVYLQENIHEEYLKIIDMMILDGISSYIVAKFILKISSTDNTTLLVDQEGDSGVILTKSGLMLESDSNIDTIALSNYTYGVTNYAYCKCTQALASYDMKTETIVEERKALDLITQTLVYNRKIDKIEIVVYTQSEYEALTQEEKDQLVFLGSTIAQGLGQPLIIVDKTDVAYISARINDYVITFDMLDPDIMFPQKMVASTSTGSVDDHYYEVPSPVNIENDLNYIRTMLRDIKGSDNWDDTYYIVRGTIPEITTLWKNGVFLGYYDEFESTLSSTGFINVKGGSGLLYDNIKHMSSSTGLYLVDNTEYTVGDWITNDGEMHYIGTIPSSFYLAYTSTGNATITDLRIIRVIGEVVSEFQRADDPANPIPGDDYYYDTSTGMIVSLHTGIMQSAYVICQYKYKIPKISTVRLTAYGLDIVEGSESFYPEPWAISSTGILSIGEVTQPGLPYLPELTTVPITSQRNSLREVREILSTDIATYNETGTFREFPDYAVHRLSIKHYDQAIVSTWSVTGNTNTARLYPAGCGTQNLALYFGGEAGTYQPTTEKFVTSIWTTNASWNLNTARSELAGCGIQDAALSFGGFNGSDLATTEKFNGNLWTTNSSWNLNTVIRRIAGCGTQSSALSFGGIGPSAVTEKFDGSTWTTSYSWNLNTARWYLAGAGSQLAGLSFGGTTGALSSVTEKYNGSSWSTAGNLSIARKELAGIGLQTAALTFGGYTTAVINITEKFNGSVWSTSTSTNPIYARYGHAGSGIQSTALSFGGTGTRSEKFNDTITSTGIIVDKGLYWDLSTKETYDNVFSLIGEVELHTIIHAQEDDELWIETFTGTSEDLELKIEYTTSTGGFDDIIYITIPESSGLDYKPIVKLLHKGFDKGYHKVNISINSTINESWIVSGSLNTARYTVAGAGTQDASIAFGGAGPTALVITEKFNGSTWTASGSLNTARQQLAGCGLQNSGLAFGGWTGSSYLASTEKFDGSAWTTSVSWNLNTARRDLAGAGIQSAGLSFGGYTGSYSGVTEKFNGTSWTTTGNLNTSRAAHAGCGIQSAALSFGGSTGSFSAVTEKFNGATWTTSSSLNIARSGLAGAGTQSAALSFGGSTGTASIITEKFNGSIWSIYSDLNIARSFLSGSGIINYALSFGGFSSTYSAVTEKFNITTFYFRKLLVGKLDTYYNTTSQYIDNIQSTNIQTENIHVNTILITSTGNLSYVNSDFVDSAHLSTDNTLYNNSDYLIPSEKTIKEYTQNYIPTCTVYKRDTYTNDYNTFTIGDIWSTNSSWNLNTARRGLAGSGIQSAALSFGGYTTGAVGTTEKFNGISWSSSGNLNTARYYIAGCGLQSAALSFGGSTGSVSSITEKFDGSTWTVSGSLNTARRLLAGAGTQNASISFGGTTGSNSAVTEKFDGSTWSTNASWNLNTARQALAGCGSQSPALAFGGSTGSDSAITEKFDGSTWSITGSLNTARQGLAGCGEQSAALSFGGTSPGSAVTEKFDGTSWTTTGNLNTPRYYIAGCGTQSSALSFGGYDVSNSAVTEKLISCTNSLILTVTNTNPTLVLDTWTTSGNLNTQRSYQGGSGTQNAALVFGGHNGSNLSSVEKFNNTAWSTSTVMTAVRLGLVGCGVQNATLAAFGGTGTPPTLTYSPAIVYKFDGYAWTNITSTASGTARYWVVGCGIQNAAVSFGGFTSGYVTTTEKFNGVSWTASGALNVAKECQGYSGIQNAALCIGGLAAAVTISAVEKFNGSVWTYTGYLNSAMYFRPGCGIQNATICPGGTTTTSNYFTTTEKYNGSSWINATSINTARFGHSGAGSQNSALIAGGLITGPAYTPVTEKFIGTINFNSIIKVTSDPGVSPSTEIVNTVIDASSQIIVNTPATCEVWLDPIISADQVEKEQLMYLGLYYPLNIAWSTSGSLNTARKWLGGCGIQSSALSFGGTTTLSDYLSNTEKFNGSTWAIVSSPALTGRLGLAGCGTQSAGLSFGGYSGSGLSAVTEKFNGTVWSATGSLNTARYYIAGCGTQSASLSFGGNNTGTPTGGTYVGLETVELFNGSTWSSVVSLNTARYTIAGCGIKNAAITFGGGEVGYSYSAVTEKFNGITWSNEASLNIRRSMLAGCGTQNAALSFGGSLGPFTSVTESYNGVSWIVLGNLTTVTTGKYGLAGCGTQQTALAFGGDTGSITNVTEKFNYTVSPLLSSGTRFIVDVRN